MKDKTIIFRVEQETKDKAAKAAEMEERKVGDYMYRLLIKDLKEKGLM